MSYSLFLIQCTCLFPGCLKVIVCFTVFADSINNLFQGALEAVVLQFALPDNHYVPSFGFQFSPDFLVTFLVAGNFCLPEVRVRLGCGGVLTVFMTMPEAAVDEDDGAVLGEDDVGRAGEAAVEMEAPVLCRNKC